MTRTVKLYKLPDGAENGVIPMEPQYLESARELLNEYLSQYVLLTQDPSALLPSVFCLLSPGFEKTATLTRERMSLFPSSSLSPVPGPGSAGSS